MSRFDSVENYRTQLTPLSAKPQRQSSVSVLPNRDEEGNKRIALPERTGQKGFTLPGRARIADKSKTVQTFSVEELKKGGDLSFNGVLNQSAGENTSAGEPQDNAVTESVTIRERGNQKKPAAMIRREHNATLPLEERLDKLTKIRKSAVQYESLFVDHLVKQMRQSPLANMPGGETLNDIAEQPFRDFLSQAGGLGLADTIVDQVARQEGLDDTLKEHPEVMGPNWHPNIPPNRMNKNAGNLDMAAPQKEERPEVPTANLEKTAEQKTGNKSSYDTSINQPQIGLMNKEEIAWLYDDAGEIQA